MNIYTVTYVVICNEIAHLREKALGVAADIVEALPGEGHVLLLQEGHPGHGLRGLRGLPALRAWPRGCAVGTVGVDGRPSLGQILR